jgi:penicillin-binding protein 2
MVALTALEQGIAPTQQFTCGGSWAWGGRVWHCDSAHGTLDMKMGIAKSCDIYFYQLALKIGGPDPIADTARRFGLGQTYDIGFAKNEQRPGLIPDTAYKKRAFPKDPVWHPGETPSMGIGQGYVNVNPLQLCVMCSRIANGQKQLQPRLVRSIGGVEQPSGAAVPGLNASPEHMQFLHDAMVAVVTSGTAAGPAANLGLGPITMAGKTGTAQSHGYSGGRGAHGSAGAWDQRDHAWFIAFAPADDPRYAMSVLTEHGGFGASASAPKAREIMRVALLKDPEVRARIEQPTPGAAAPAAPATPGAAPAPPAEPGTNAATGAAST